MGPLNEVVQAGFAQLCILNETVKMDKLQPHVIYKTRPPIIMSENPSNRKKGMAYMVLAPSVETELNFLSKSTVVKYRYIANYFVEYSCRPKLYGKPATLIRPAEDNRLSQLISDNAKGNLDKVDHISTMRQTAKSNQLRGLNMLVEINHIIEQIITNTKDRRKPIKSAEDMEAELIRVTDIDYIGEYQRHMLIPMELWFSDHEYANPASTLKPTSKNYMAHILQHILVPGGLVDKFVHGITLLDANLILTFMPNSIPEGMDGTEYVRSQLIKFMKLGAVARKRGIYYDKDIVVVEPDGSTTQANEAPADNADTAAEEAAAAQAESKAELAAEELKDAVADSDDDLDADTKTEIEASVKNDVDLASSPKSFKTSSGPVDEIDFGDDEEDVVTDSLTNVNNIPISQETQDAMLKATLGGRSVASQKRNEMLRAKLNDYHIGDNKQTIGQLVKRSDEIALQKVEVKANTINPALKDIQGQGSEVLYNKELADYDLANILLHFSTAVPALYLIKDVVREDVSTATERVWLYKADFEDENRKRHHLRFRLPKMYKDRYLFLNGQEFVITHQKIPFPITCVQPDRCQLVTSYNKVFVYRYGASMSPRINQLKKILNSESGNIVCKRGDCTRLNANHLTTLEFDEFSANFTQISIGTRTEYITLIFDPEILDVTFGAAKPPEKVSSPIDGSMIADENLFPLAIKRTKKETIHYWLSGTNNHVYDKTGASHGELAEFMMQSIVEYNPSMEETLANSAATGKYMYSKIRIMHEDLPLIVIMGAADPDGLQGALAKGKINYQFLEKRPSVDKNKTGVIPFKDGYLIFDRYPFENSLLMNGLSAIPTKEYDFYDLNTRDAYVDIFDLLCGKKRLVDHLRSFYYMMVDPITRDVLIRLKMPTDFITLLHYCNGVLVDNQYQIESNYENCRIRSNEIVMVHLYRNLAIAWSKLRSGEAEAFSVPEDCVIKELLVSKIVDPKSKLNITLELEEDRSVKLMGPSGMNEARSFTIEKRAYHPTMRGVIGTNSVPSGNVGIARHMVTNANINDARGFITVNKDSYDGTELLTPGEMLAPFASDSGDIERLCMEQSQSKHMLPVEDQCSWPIGYDFERVAPYISDDFSTVAKQDGKVIEISEDIMIIKYDDGTIEDIDLSDKPARNTDGGFAIMHKIEPMIKAGARFKKGDIIAKDPKVINDNDFYGDPCVNVGTLARVAFKIGGNVHEDSAMITDRFAHRFASRITKEKHVILSKFANIKYMVKVGQDIQANDPLITFDDTEDEYTSQLMRSMAEEMDDADVISATTAPVVSKFTGIIRDIDIVYTIPISEMTPSMAKIVTEYSKNARRREKALSKYVSIRDANTLTKTSEISVPDSMGKVGGTKIGDGIMITFYIEYLDVAGNGDKGSIGALKFTVNSHIIPDELAAYTESNPDRPIDVIVSAFGNFKRMVANVEKVGILTKVLIETKRREKEAFFDWIESEYKRIHKRK